MTQVVQPQVFDLVVITRLFNGAVAIKHLAVLVDVIELLLAFPHPLHKPQVKPCVSENAFVQFVAPRNTLFIELCLVTQTWKNKRFGIVWPAACHVPFTQQVTKCRPKGYAVFVSAVSFLCFFEAVFVVRIDRLADVHAFEAVVFAQRVLATTRQRLRRDVGHTAP